MTSPRDPPDGPGPATRYRVTIYYREPGYARSRGIDDREYRGTFTVSARDDAEAERLAIARFKEISAKATVSWERRITRVSCVRED